MNALEQAFNMFKQGTQNVFNSIGKSVGNIGNKMGNVFSVLTDSPQTIPQDWQYRAQQLKNDYQKGLPNLIHLPFKNGPSALEQAQMQLYQKASPIGKLGLDTILGEGSMDTPTARASADYNRYYLSAPPQDKLGLSYKQQVLSNNNFLPAAQKYLQTIPYSGSTHMDTKNAGQSQSNPLYPGERFIQYDPRVAKDKNFSIEVAAHEILHQAVGVFGEKQLGSFLNDFGKALRQDPQHYRPIAQWLADYRADRKGTGYFDDPLTAANEMFAQIGAVLGPGMVNDPYLGQYYRKVFQSNKTPLPPPQMRGRGIGSMPNFLPPQERFIPKK